MGMLLTWLFLPDTTGLDLKEQERRWQYLRTGREADYHGVAVHPKHLSLWERWRGVGRYYDPELDFKQKIGEMRSEWEANEARRHAEKMGEDDEEFLLGGDIIVHDCGQQGAHFTDRGREAVGGCSDGCRVYLCSDQEGDRVRAELVEKGGEEVHSLEGVNSRWAGVVLELESWDDEEEEVHEKSDHLHVLSPVKFVVNEKCCL